MQEYLNEAQEMMEMAILHVEDELARIRAGKANTRILDGIRVDSYGSMVPLSNVASVTTPDARTIAIKPWDKNIIIALTDLHIRLMHSSKFPFYQAAYYKALPFIVELRAKGGQDKAELENCFDALYGVWMLRLQRKEVGKETVTALADIVKFVGLLSDYYAKERAGELELEE